MSTKDKKKVAPKDLLPKSSLPADDDEVMQVDKDTANVIREISRTIKFNSREVTRWLAWVGRKAMGRRLIIEEGSKQIQVSLEDYPKMSPPDLS